MAGKKTKYMAKGGAMKRKAGGLAMGMTARRKVMRGK